MEAGDVILEVDGKKITSPEDYLQVVHGAANTRWLKLKIKDKNATGNITIYYVIARKRAP
jgi:hypothetical protein